MYITLSWKVSFMNLHVTLLFHFCDHKNPHHLQTRYIHWLTYLLTYHYYVCSLISSGSGPDIVPRHIYLPFTQLPHHSIVTNPHNIALSIVSCEKPGRGFSFWHYNYRNHIALNMMLLELFWGKGQTVNATFVLQFNYGWKYLTRSTLQCWASVGAAM